MRTLLPIAFFLVAGCTATVSQQEIAAAHFGAAPKNFEKTIRGLLANRINDPAKAKYRFLAPAKGFGLVAGQKRFGWIVKAYINVKNNKGEFIGDVAYYFLFAEGKTWDVTDLFSFGRARFIDPPKE